MKTFLKYLRSSSLALTGAIALAACGGYTGLTLGGSVSGLTNSGLVLANGGDTVSVPANATSYAFPNEVSVGSSFHVTIQSQPEHMTCIVADITGTVGTTATSNINVACTQITHSVGGTISGLTEAGWAVINGTDSLAVAASATAITFTMPSKVGEQSIYGITMLPPQPPATPTNLKCIVVNGTATMGAADVTNVQVNCSPI